MCVMIFYSYSPGVAIVELASLSDGRCLRCGLPVRSATVPSTRCSVPLPIERPPTTDVDATGSRSCDVTSDARRNSKDNIKCVTFADDVDGRRIAASATANKRVRFAALTDDVTDDVSRQLEPVTPPPPGSSFIQMQTADSVCRSLLQPSTSATTLSTFVRLSQDPSIV